MNGRLYDPVVHRFLQPDNFIQDQHNTQNYNRYGYVLNNPLKYTDPSGEEFLTMAAIGIGVGIATYLLNAIAVEAPITFQGVLQTVIMSVFSSTLSFGVGEATQGITNLFLKASVQAVAHGTIQGGLSEFNGGKFVTGFASGSLSSIASSLWSGGGEGQWQGVGGKFADSGVGIIAFGTISGGAGASLTGGNFWQGAATGFIVSGLNHAMHSENCFADEYDQQGRKVTKASLGIKKGDTKETMIDKTIKGMKVGDYITGEDASFLGEDAKTYIKTITRTGATSFKIDGDSNWMGIRAFKTGATMEISHLKKPILMESGAKLSYKITINGLTSAGKAGYVYPVYYLGKNTSYTYFDNGYHKIPN